jgi:hypothetical protein
MSTTLRKLTAQAIRQASGGDVANESVYDERYVAERMRQLLNEILFEKIMTERRKEPVYQYLYRYEVSPDKSTYYATVELEDFYIDLPRNRGIYSVSPKDDDYGGEYNTYKRRLSPSVSRNLKCGQLEGQVGWWPEGNKVILHPKPKVADTVVVKVQLAAPMSIGMDDRLPMLPEQQNNLINQMVAILLNTPPEDTVINEKQDNK